MDKLEKERVLPIIRRALREDIGKCDKTTESIVPENYNTSGRIILKERAILSGLDIVELVFNELGNVEVNILIKEGVWVDLKNNEPVDIISIKGDARAILMGERVALNFIQRMSGISTLTGRYVEEVDGTGAVILDTRKTTPNLRYLEKFAVKMGEGKNHRMGLYDKVLIKENHIKIVGSIIRALEKKKGEIEVRNFREAKDAIKGGAERLLLDNMTLGELRKIVEMTEGKGIELEASGGVNLDNVRDIAETGVNYISIGALTHSYKSIDISLILDDESNSSEG